jgi:hypothetical protein
MIATVPPLSDASQEAWRYFTNLGDSGLLLPVALLTLVALVLRGSWQIGRAHV